jgi:hypothetical protein
LDEHRTLLDIEQRPMLKDQSNHVLRAVLLFPKQTYLQNVDGKSKMESSFSSSSWLSCSLFAPIAHSSP